MNIKENIKIAVFSIRANLMRSLLTMLGIIIGVASVIAIVTVGNGGRDYIVGMIRDMGSSAISITVNVMNTDVSNSDYLTDEDISAVKALENVQYVSPMAMTVGSLSVGGSDDAIGVIVGGNSDLRYVMNGDCIYGRFFTRAEVEAARQVCVMDATSAVQIFGKKNVVGEYVDFTFNNVSAHFKIVGVTDLVSTFGGDTEKMLENMQSMTGIGIKGAMILVPSSVATQLIGGETRYDSIYIMATEESDLENAGNAALNRIRARHNNFGRDCYTVTNMATYIDLLDTVINVFTIFIAAVSAISLIVGGIGVMNIMLVSITERTREIGIRKALGAKTSSILFQFLTESVILCLIGGVIGLILGVTGASVVSEVMHVPLEVKLSTVALAVGFSTAIGIIFGVYPARRAAKMLPIDALRRD